LGARYKELGVGKAIAPGALVLHLTILRKVGRTMKTLQGDTQRSEPRETKSAVEGETRTSEERESNPGMDGWSRRTFLGVGSAGLATAALAALAVNAQEKSDTEKAD
jgi:hypothetical protein